MKIDFGLIVRKKGYKLFSFFFNIIIQTSYYIIENIIQLFKRQSQSRWFLNLNIDKVAHKKIQNRRGLVGLSCTETKLQGARATPITIPSQTNIDFPWVNNLKN